MLQGYDDLRDRLVTFATELQSLGLDVAAARLQRAAAFRVGSPTEFLGESLYALDDVVADTPQLPASLSNVMKVIADELEDALTASRYSPRRRRVR